MSVHPFTSLCFILLFFVVALCGSMAIQVLAASILLLLSLFIRKRKQAWKTIALYIVPVSCLLILVNAALGAPLALGVTSALRIILLITPLVIVVHTGSSADFSVALRTLPIPSRLQYIFIFSFEIIQSLREIFKAVLIAQQLRGYRVERSIHKKWKSVFPLLLPVTLIAMSQSLDRSLSYEFKGIESTVTKTFLRTLPLTASDRWTIALLLLLSVVLIIASLFS